MKIKSILVFLAVLLVGVQAEESRPTRAVFLGLTLQQGWNAFSPQTVLTVANYKGQGLDYVLGYDAASKSYVQVEKCLPGKAYWAYCKSDKMMLTLQETPQEAAQEVKSGWNFVGYVNAYPAWASKATTIWKWIDGRFVLVDDAKKELKAGVGYWVYVE